MEIRITPIDTTINKSLQELSDFLSSVFPNTDKFDLNFLQWQYNSCPDGKMIGFNAYDGDKLISHFAALPLKMSFFGKEYKGAACLNVSTASNYRGKKLFTKLGQATIDYAQENKFDFLIAVPNSNSSHTFLKYFDFQFIAPLQVKVGFGLPKYKEELPNAFKIWSDSLLDWRLKNPANTYLIKDPCIYTPISFFAKTVNRKPIKINRLNNNLILRPLNLYIGLGTQLGKSYFSLPKWIKRPPFNLVFKDLTGNIPKLKEQDFFMQLIDLDTI